MASMEEIMITFNSKENVSDTTKKIDGSVQSMVSNISAAMSKMNQGFMSLSTGMNSMLGGLTGGKTASDIIFGTASKAETNKVLLDMMTETEDASKSLYETVDKVTDSSLTSMQELIPAMNSFKAATGASDKELENVTDEMANFGAAVLAQTGSTELAQSAMMDLSKGIKGAFASLDQYGVSEDALKRTGLWSGKEDDVEGYMAAVEKVVGSTEKLMETNQGLDALIGKSFSRAGKKIGNEFLPIIKDIKRGFIDLDTELGGGLAATILIASEGVDVLSQSLFTASTMINGVQDIAGAFHDVRDAIKGASNAAEGFNNSLNIASNASDMAGLTGVAGAGDVAKGASKTEKAVDLGVGGLTAADILKNNSGKEYDKIIDSIKDLNKKEKLIQSELDTTQQLNKTIDSITGLDPEGALAKLKKGMSKTGDMDEFIETSRKEAKKLSNKDVTFTGIIKGKFDTLKTGWDSALGSVENFVTDGFGTKLQNLLETGFSGLGNTFKNIKTKFGKLSTSIKDLSFGDVKGAFLKPFNSLADGAKKIPGKIKNIGSTLNSGLGQTISDFSFVDTFKGLKDKFKGLKGAEEVGEDIKKMGQMAEGVGDAAPMIEAGAAGAEGTAAATTTLSGAFTSMIVPALALSAVIMIMIPIVAVIAAEAMVFIKLLGEFMEALHFESIDLSGAVEGLKSIAMGLLYVGVAMAAMTFTSIMTGLAIVTSGFTGITTPLKVAKDAIMDAAKELQSFGSINIDPSIATNLQAVSDSLSAVSNAMSSMTWTNITTGFSNWVADVLGFSSITDGIEQAKDEIIKASSKLQEFSSLTPLPDGVANNIQNVCNSLASVGDAMGALRSIRDSQNWDDMIGSFINGLFGGGVDIATALDNVKTDITNAANALSGWSVPSIPEGLGDNIKKVSDALNSISEAFETLRSFRDNNNFDQWMEGLFGGQDIDSALTTIINDINNAASKLSGLNIQKEVINEDLITGIKNIVNALTEVSNVASGLTSLPKMENFDSNSITNVMTNVQTAADALKGLTVGEVNEETITNIKNVGNAIREVSSVMTGLTTLPPMEGFDTNSIATAVNTVKTAATELGNLSTTTFGDGGDPSSILSTINTAITGLRDTLTNLSGGFSAPATGIGSQIVSGVQSGLAPLGGAVQSSVSSAISSASGAASSGGQSLGTQTTDGFRSTLKLADVMNAEMGYVKSAVDSGISAAVSAAQSGAEKVVEAFKAGIETGSPGAMAWATYDEMGYIKGFIEKAKSPLSNATYKLAQGIVGAFGNPSLNLNNLLNDSFTTWNMDQLSAIDTVNSQAPPSTTNNNSTTIIFNEGAMPIDARNMTSYEAKQWLILALESLGIDFPIRGM